MRLKVPGAFYHCLNPAVERRRIFEAPEDYDQLLEIGGRLEDRARSYRAPFVLSSNHP